MVKLLALDLDDTLLRADLTISERNRAAIQRVEEAGVQVVLASGRSIPAMEKYAEVLGMFDRPGYMISDNGSVVSSTCPRKILLTHVLEKELYEELFDAFAVLDLPVQVYDGRTILVTRDNDLTLVDMQLSGYGKKVVPHLKHELSFLPRKLVIPGDPELLPSALSVIRSTFEGRVNAFISKPYFLEVLPPQADKGSALQFVAEKLGMVSDEIMAMGDAANDIGMIRFAGLGIAMANAVPEVKMAAKLVTESTHEDDGVAEILDRFL